MTERFGKYEVRGLLGEGGFGKVYRGWDPDLKREVAIKTCTFSEERLRRRFVQEAEVAAGLGHPNIVTVHDFGTEDGEPYLVQDLLEGEDLDVLIREGRTGDLRERVDLLRQIAQGLRHAHGRDVVHRDVKPANVRVSPDGRARILDFGIAKVLTAEEELTRTGMSLGTAGYVSPEQLRDVEVDQRADIFSFGVVAYELISGRRPFSGGSISELFYQISHEEPPPLREVAPDCDPDLAAVVERCLAKDRDDRYGDFDEVLEALDGAGAGAADGAGGTAPARSKRIALAAVAVGVAAGAAFGAYRFVDDAGGQPDPGGPAAVATAGEDGSDAGTESVDGDETTAPGGGESEARAATAGNGEPGDGGGDPGAGETADRRAPAGSGGDAAGEGAADGAVAARTTGAETDGAPSPGDTAAPPPSSGVLVVVEGEGAPGQGAAENVLLSQLSDAGFRVVDRTSRELQARAAGDDPAPGALGRRAGTAVVVLARYRADATRSVGASYTGSATLSVRSYDTRTGDLLTSETHQVGGGGTPGEAGSTPSGAATKAAEKVAHQAAFALTGLLRRHLEAGGS